MGYFFVFFSVLSLLISTSFAIDISREKLVFHKAQEAAVTAKPYGSNGFEIAFEKNNPFFANAWLSWVYPEVKQGCTYILSVKVMQKGATDPQSRIVLTILGADANAVYLGTSPATHTVWGANCSQWTPVMLKFTVPAKGMDAKWDNAKVFLTSFSVLSANGTFYFKDFAFTKLK